MASNPFGITQVDAPGLLHDYTQRQFSFAQHAAALRKEQREAVAERAHAVGNAAMFVSRLPPSQQADAWDRAVDQLVGQGYKDLAPYRGKYDPSALPGLIAASSEASQAYIAESDKDREYQLNVEQFGETHRHNAAGEANQDRSAGLAERQLGETQRHNRVGEDVAIGNLGVSRSNLSLSRQREARVTKWGPQPLIGTVGIQPPSTTDDLNY